ncbi:hypothetical protein [Bacteroides fluxus]|uniref:hypothetical protein n=1 Tax=Bacteroides fluxus TaxID=626930 RepID=UPI002354B9FD|nr:hypothetical protein [Bacteroides fluxus]
MASSEDLPLYRDTLRLLNLLIPLSQGFPRFYKYSLGTRMVDVCLDMSIIAKDKGKNSFCGVNPVGQGLPKRTGLFRKKNIPANFRSP